MTPLFERGLKVVLHHEGGFVHDVDDPGGATNYGISLRFLKSVVQGVKARGITVDLDGDGDVDPDDIRLLDPEMAGELYYEFFWDKRFEELQDPVAIKTFDYTVNMGKRQAVKLLQRACNKTTSADLIVDGILGSKTIEAARCSYTPALLWNLNKEAMKFYNRLVEQKPELKKFLNGWGNRATSLNLGEEL